MKSGLSSRLHRDVYRLINIGAVGTVSDAELLDRFVAQRDEAAEAAFEELVNRHAPMVLQVCRAVLRDPHDAEDAFQADVERWDAELKRLRQSVDPPVHLKPTNESKANAAARNAARAAIERAEADVISYRLALSTASVDVSVANAALAVADCEKQRIQELAGDFTVTAPFDGLIVARNANVFDAVRPLTGQPSAQKRPPAAPARDATPLYVVAKVDVVRVSIDIPEQDASYVRVGTRASVLVKVYRDEPIQATIVRTSWAVNGKSRVLRAEIDLPNPDGKLKVGMYAYGEVIVSDLPALRRDAPVQVAPTSKGPGG